MTYTYVLMEVSPSTYKEVRKKLEEAGYFKALHQDREDGILLDMHGIALKLEKTNENENTQRNSKARKQHL